MPTKSIMLLVAFTLVLGLAFAFAGEAVAQDTNELSSKDKDLAQKKGVSQSLGNRKLGGEDQEGVTKAQAALGLGSCVVMIAVVKWL